MRVAIDARPAVSAGMTGVGYYAWHLIHRLPAVDPQTTYLAWYLNARGALRPRRFFADVRAPNLVERSTPFPARLFERLSERYELPRVEWFVRFDVLFAPNFVPPPTRTRRLVLTVHDLAFRLFPETAPLATRRWLRRLDGALRQAAHVLVPSTNTREDLLHLYPVDPDRVSVVPLGVDPERFRPPPPEEVERVRREYGVEGLYLLSLGGIEPRKNLPRLLEAVARLDADVRLVVAGAAVPWNPEGTELLRVALAGLPAPARRRMVLTGYVSERDKVALLGGAEALVYPSLYEGFGLPVMEAMACGTPVVTSDVAALPETAGGAAVLVDPGDPAAITEGIERLLSGRKLRARLRREGLERAARFSWSETARRTAAILHLVAG